MVAILTALLGNSGVAVSAVMVEPGCLGAGAYRVGPIWSGYGISAAPLAAACRFARLRGRDLREERIDEGKGPVMEVRVKRGEVMLMWSGVVSVMRRKLVCLLVFATG